MSNLLYWDPQQRALPQINKNYLDCDGLTKIHSASLYAAERMIYRLDPEGILSMWSWLTLRLGLALLIPLSACWGLAYCISLFATAAISMVNALTSLIIGTIKLIGYGLILGLIILFFSLFNKSN